MDFTTRTDLAAPGPREEGRTSPSDPGLAALLDEFAHGIVVVDVHGKLIHANYAGRAELARGRVIGLRQHRVEGLHPEGERVLREGLAKSAGGRRSLLELQALEGAHLTALLAPVREPGGGVHTRHALLIARAAVCDPLMLCFFARRHGLTPTEEQVLGLLCEGHSAPEAANRLKVAVSTVRSHVRSLCLKTKSNGTRELVSRVALLPPLAPAFAREAVH